MEAGSSLNVFLGSFATSWKSHCRALGLELWQAASSGKVHYCSKSSSFEESVSHCESASEIAL